MPTISMSGSTGIPKYRRSKAVLVDGTTINSVYVTVTWVGSIKFFLAADLETMEEVTGLTSGVQGTYEFTTPGTAVGWYALLKPGAYITEVRLKKAS